MENLHVVIVYDYLDVLHAAVTHFKFISVLGVVFGKWIAFWYEKDWPVLIVTLLLYGGLNHITFLW